MQNFPCFTQTCAGNSKSKNIVTLKLAAAAAVDEVISYLFLIKLNFDDDVLTVDDEGGC